VIERIGTEVEREVARLGPEAGVGEITRAWPDAVGAVIARNAWPARVGRDRTLHVATSSSAWAFELAQLAPQILDRLRAALRHETRPNALRFAPGRVPDPPTPPGGPTNPGGALDPTPEERALADAVAAEIEHEELRRLVGRAAAAALARAAREVVGATGDDRRS
jgi:hypothetical protein